MISEIEKFLISDKKFYPFVIYLRDGSSLRILKRESVEIIDREKCLRIRNVTGETESIVDIIPSEVAMMELIREALPTRIVVVDPRPLFVAGVGTLISAEMDMDLVGTASVGDAAVRVCADQKPDVVVMNASVEKIHASEATRRIIHDIGRCKVILMASTEHDAQVGEGVQAGASGCITEGCSPVDFISAIRRTRKGEAVFSPEISDYLLASACLKQAESAKPAAALTQRELDVLRLIANGKVNRQMASELGISVKAVEKHRQTVMDKLDIHDIAGLTRYAMAAGVIPVAI